MLGRGLLFHSANDKVRRTQWIPACAGMTSLNINFLSRLCCVRFRVPIPACAGMTIFVNKNCKKYFDKLLFIKATLPTGMCRSAPPQEGNKKIPRAGGFFISGQSERCIAVSCPRPGPREQPCSKRFARHEPNYFCPCVPPWSDCQSRV